jgi:hypothetical protein
MLSPGLHARSIPPPPNQLLEWRSKSRLMLLKPPKDPPEVLFANLTLLTPQERREPMAGVIRLRIRQTSPTEREPPRPRPNQFKPRTQPRQFQGNCHKCGRKGHLAKDYRAPPYIVNMYRELQQLRNQTRQAYNFENSNSAPQPAPYTEDIKNTIRLSTRAAHQTQMRPS